VLLLFRRQAIEAMLFLLLRALAFLPEFREALRVKVLYTILWYGV
jgi:hypothetical protein